MMIQHMLLILLELESDVPSYTYTLDTYVHGKQHNSMSRSYLVLY